ncbi:MAG: hypothetical protein V3U92_19585 [Cellulophaga sp.]
MKELSKLICKRCGHSWIPRVENPKWCPYCKSPYWNKERQKTRLEEKIGHTLLVLAGAQLGVGVGAQICNWLLGVI